MNMRETGSLCSFPVPRHAFVQSSHCKESLALPPHSCAGTCSITEDGADSTWSVSGKVRTPSVRTESLVVLGVISEAS